jgi:Fungal specific transcription factor domain
MCVLCRDTFSRSDILKRHFQKCSIRRGNPTGASHLSAQAHLKKSTSRSAVEDLLRNMNGVNSLPADSNVVHPFGVIPDIPDRRAPDGSSSLTDEQVKQEQNSQSNSLKRLSSGGGRNRRSLTGPGPGGSSRASFDQNHVGDIPTTMSSNMNTQLPTFSMPNGHNGTTFSQNYDFASRSNGGTLQPQEDMSTMTNGRGAMPMFGGASSAQQSGVDWSQMFQPGAQDGFMGPFNTNLDHNQIVIKTEPPMTLPNDGLFTGLYPIASGVDHPDASEATFPSWNMPYSHHDPFQQIANAIVDFCCLANTPLSTQIHDIRDYLSVSNVKHFLEQYTNFQGHFPIIHMSTFRITETYNGLLLAMICVGAVYSDRITAGQVRELMEQAKLAIERDSRVFSAVSWDSVGSSNFSEELLGRHKTELEEIQAIFLLHVLFTWHGTPVQREMARRNFPMLIKIVRSAGLARPSTVPESFSVLHQPNVVVEHFNSANFNWNAWVEQEKRSRLFYVVYLCDAAMALYFNIRPYFDSYEICLPLPADDAAWDARTAGQCANALGLRGPVAAKDLNVEGSGHAKQPELHTALQSLMDANVNLKAGTTNLYSKFILIHALHVQIWLVQRQQSADADLPNTHGLPLSRSGTTTPSSQNDWGIRSTDGSINGRVTGNSSRRATPVDLEGQANGTLLAINKALDKWKMAWDEDMATQYPPSSTSYKRFGFCRDGVHFYYLAKYLITHKLDWYMAPDQRLTFVMHLLKSAKIYVVPDSAKRGEGLGSVNDIDQNYGVSDLTLDMAHLFKPINKELNSPIPGIHTNISTGLI